MSKNQKETDESPKDLREEIVEFGDVECNGIEVLTIIGEIEGHDILASNCKSTKYEHILPKLAQIEESRKCKGLLLIINTVGGDVSAGLALAEMVASISKPKVALVIGDCHSIGVPLAVSCDYSYIAPTGTMIVHPVRMSGTVIGAPPTYDYFKSIQDRIVRFIAKHSTITEKELEKMMMRTGILTKDLGTLLVGKETVEKGLIDEVGGISDAFMRLHKLIKKSE